MGEKLVKVKEQESGGDGTILYNKPNNTKSSFSAQTVNISGLNAYNILEIFFIATASSNQIECCASSKIYKLKDGQFFSLFNSDGAIWYQRRTGTINWTSGDVVFQGGFLLKMSDNTASSDDARCVPYAIVGYK
jgi:hypothetical protein